jgi:predicted metal-dependent RNase
VAQAPQNTLMDVSSMPASTARATMAAVNEEGPHTNTFVTGPGLRVGQGKGQRTVCSTVRKRTNARHEPNVPSAQRVRHVLGANVPLDLRTCSTA